VNSHASEHLEVVLGDLDSYSGIFNRRSSGNNCTDTSCHRPRDDARGFARIVLMYVGVCVDEHGLKL
jgi:hypothetical protein